MLCHQRWRTSQLGKLPGDDGAAGSSGQRGSKLSLHSEFLGVSGVLCPCDCVPLCVFALASLS